MSRTVQGLVIWLKGLENLNPEKYCGGLPGSTLPLDKTSFMEAAPDLPPEMSALEHFSNFLRNLQDAVVIKPGAVIDVTVKGRRMRYIVDSLTLDEMYDYVYGAPADLPVFIAARPKGVTKSEVEDRLSAENKLLIDQTIPKGVNLARLVAKKWGWNKECFLDKFYNAIFDNIVKNGLDLTFSILKSLFQIFQ
ncbi:MAG: hypothetical protein K2J12_00210 [Muribaculaceae bacterium]|nr:hypothetical protein [Muribaculaceae bacterium]